MGMAAGTAVHARPGAGNPAQPWGTRSRCVSRAACKQERAPPGVLGAVMEDGAGTQEEASLCWETWRLAKGPCSDSDQRNGGGLRPSNLAQRRGTAHVCQQRCWDAGSGLRARWPQGLGSGSAWASLQPPHGGLIGGTCRGLS